MTPAGVVVAGAGQAGFQVAVTLRKAGYEGPVRIVGEEAAPPYQRPPLSKAFMLADDGPETVHLRPASFYAKQSIELIGGDRVERADRSEQRIELASGGGLDYDHLVLALGSRPRALRVPGAELDGVHDLRTLADAQAIRDRLATARRVVVVGGGFIGLEFASSASKRGAAVTVIEALERPMARVVSPEMSDFYVRLHGEAGVEILLATGVEELTGEDGRVTGVRTADGRALEAELVLAGIGVVPNTEPAAASGLVIDDGIVVDEQLVTADPAISAVGDCAAFLRHGRRVRLESVQNAVDHARCAGARIAGSPAPYTALPWFWSDQHDTKLQIAGIATTRERAVVRGDVDAGAFSVFCFTDDRLIAVESVNSPRDHMAARGLLAAAPDLTPDEAADPSFDLKARAQAAS